MVLAYDLQIEGVWLTVCWEKGTANVGVYHFLVNLPGKRNVLTMELNPSHMDWQGRMKDELPSLYKKRKRKCTLPTQELSCSGSKGLSQPALPNILTKQLLPAGTDTPIA